MELQKFDFDPKQIYKKFYNFKKNFFNEFFFFHRAKQNFYEIKLELKSNTIIYNDVKSFYKKKTCLNLLKFLKTCVKLKAFQSYF